MKVKEIDGKNYLQITLCDEQLELLASKIVNKLEEAVQEKENKKIQQSLERAKLERQLLPFPLT